MDLEIDKSFAKHYDERKTKEETSKTKKYLKRKIEIVDLDSESYSSISEYEDEVDTEGLIQDYSKNIDALMAEIETKGIDAFSDNSVWLNKFEENKSKVVKSKPLFGKDLNSQILLKRGNDDENRLRELEEVAKIDSKDIANMAPKIDLSMYCNFDADLVAPSKAKRKFENIDPLSDEEINDINESRVSEDEEMTVHPETMMVLNMGRHEDTLRNKSSKRKEKRKQITERKKAERKETIKQLQKIEMDELEKKFEKIKKTNPSILKYLKPEDLAEDFDPNKHNDIINNLFDLDEEAYPADEEKPIFSDDDFDYDKGYDDEAGHNDTGDANKNSKKTKSDDEESFIAKSKKKNSCFVNINMENDDSKAVKKINEIYDPNEHGSFKKFIKNHAPIICDDIIKGPDGQHTLCKFKYRSVAPQDFGLTLEEIMFAENKDLNKWASLKKVVTLRTNEDEARDDRHYHSDMKLQKKKDILVSVYADNLQTEKENDDDNKDTEGKISKSTKKRLRKASNNKKLKELVSSITEETTEIDENPGKEKEKKCVTNDPQVGEESNNVIEQSIIVTEDTVKKGKQEKTNKKRSNVNKEVVTEESNRGKDKNKSKPPKVKKQRIEIPYLQSNRLASYGVSEGYYRYGLAAKKTTTE